ncbi:hypothetical protein ACOMHN_004305 [Nucella lapillus]
MRWKVNTVTGAGCPPLCGIVCLLVRGVLLVILNPRGRRSLARFSCDVVVVEIGCAISHTRVSYSAWEEDRQIRRPRKVAARQSERTTLLACLSLCREASEGILQGFRHRERAADSNMPQDNSASVKDS